MATFQIAEPLRIEFSLFGSPFSFDAFATYYTLIAPAMGTAVGSIERQKIRAWLAQQGQCEPDMLAENQIEDAIAAVHDVVSAAVEERKKKVASIGSSPPPTPESPPTSASGPTN